MKIIELNGLPGCGKSTYSSDIISGLKEKTDHVLSSDSFYSIENKKILIVEALKYAAGRRFLMETLKLLLQLRLLFKADIAKRMVYCLAYIGYYYSIKKADGYLVMDEGIIQGFISALYNYNDRIPDFSGLVTSLHNLNIIFVHVGISPEEASERIKKRNSAGHGRCDDLCENERRPILQHQYGNFKAINSILEEKEKYVYISEKKDLQRLIETV